LALVNLPDWFVNDRVVSLFSGIPTVIGCSRPLPQRQPGVAGSGREGVARRSQSRFADRLETRGRGTNLTKPDWIPRLLALSRHQAKRYCEPGTVTSCGRNTSYAICPRQCAV